MAPIHNALNRGPWGTAVKAIVGDSQPVGAVERYGETLTPVLDIWSRPEFKALRREYLFADAELSAAAVGELSFVALSMPHLALSNPGPGYIAVLERLNARAAAAMTVHLRVASSRDVELTGTLLRNVAYTDLRLMNGLAVAGATPGRGRLNVFDGSDPAEFGVLIEERIATGTEVLEFENLPIIIPPGGAVVVTGVTANIALTVQFAGYERNAFRGELQLIR